MPFNKFQQEAIDTKNKDILVSAGAGSGKTSVMIERIVTNILQNEVSVDELLVVTFTNKAASEMRIKLENALKLKLSLPETDINQKNRLKEQLELLGQSDICTIHKFCQTIIQKYFYTIDLDPSFSLGDDSETGILRMRAMDKLLKDCENQKDADFLLVAKIFDEKRNFDKLKEIIYKIFDFLINLPDIQIFKNRIQKAYGTDLDNNDLSMIINTECIEMFEYFKQSFQELKQEAIFINSEKLRDYVDIILGYIDFVKPENNFSQNHTAVFAIPKLPDIPRKVDTPEETELKVLIQELKKDFKKHFDNLKDKIYISNNLGKISQDLKETKAVLEAMLNLVDKFAKNYRETKKEKNILDFSDLEHFAYEILQKDEVSKQVRNHYKQIFVDEYQDINDTQEALIASVKSKRDLFLVGDIKQSIYGFRGTNPKIFLQKQLDFRDTKNADTIAIDLNFNYRTDQKILSFVNWVFSQLMTKDLGDIDYMPDNEMTSDLEFKSCENSLPQISIDIINKEVEEKEKIVPQKVYRVTEAPIAENQENEIAQSEGTVIAQRIAELMQTQKQIYDARSKTYRDINYNDITLLCRGRSKEVGIIIDTLMEYGIPVAPISKDSVFTEYEVQVLFAYLNLVNNIYDDINMTTFLTSPIIGLDEDSLTRVRACAPARTYYYECIFDYLKNDDFIADKLKYGLSLIEDGVENLKNDTIFDVLINLCEKTNYYALVASFDDGQNRIKNVKGFINGFINKNYNTDLREYLSCVAKSDKTPDIIPAHTIGANVVKVETMHESKGLEYPIVFLVNLGHGFNRESTKGDFLLHSDLGVGVMKYNSETRVKTPTISVSAISIAIKNKEFAENMRLLYVAMTRAKNHLFITGHCAMDKFKVNTSAYALKRRNNFIELILSTLGKENISKLSSGTDNLTIPIDDKANAVVSVFPMIENVNDNENKNQFFIKNRTIDTKMQDILTKNNNYTYDFDKSTHIAMQNTVTALNKEYDKLESVNITPQKFNVAENQPLDKIDTKVGIAYHKAMQFIDFDLSNVNDVEKYLKTKMTFEEMQLIDCNVIFKAILNIKPLLQGNVKIYREQPFMMRKKHSDLVENSSINDEILVEGVIDLIIVKNNEVILLDYKTSASHNVEKTAQNYVMQLNCYEKAAQGALGMGVTSKFLYFFLQERLILIDNLLCN